MSRRTTLVAVSIAGHFAIGIGLFASGIWELERLDSDHRLGAIGVMSVTQVAGGSPADLPEPNFKKKEQKERVIPKDTVQWDKRVEKPDQKPVENAKTGGTGNGQGDGEGDKIGDGKDDVDSQGCAMPPCSPAAQPEVKLPEAPPPPVKKPPVVAPTVLDALRVQGNTQIHAPNNVKNAMNREGQTTIRGTVKFCIDTSGAVSTVGIHSPTGYPEYDQTLLAGVRGWRYRPYSVNGVPQPACSVVTFVYSFK